MVNRLIRSTSNRQVHQSSQRPGGGWIFKNQLDLGVMAHNQIVLDTTRPHSGRGCLAMLGMAHVFWAGHVQQPIGVAGYWLGVWICSCLVFGVSLHIPITHRPTLTSACCQTNLRVGKQVIERTTIGCLVRTKAAMVVISASASCLNKGMNYRCM